MRGGAQFSGKHLRGPPIAFHAFKSMTDEHAPPADHKRVLRPSQLAGDAGSSKEPARQLTEIHCEANPMAP